MAATIDRSEVTRPVRLVSSRLARRPVGIGKYYRWIAAALVVSALVSLLYLNQASDLAIAGYDVAALQAQQQLWEMRNEQLQLKIDQVESLDSVQIKASQRLAMGPPRHVIYVTAKVIPIPVDGSEPKSSQTTVSPLERLMDDVTGSIARAVEKLIAPRVGGS